MAYIKKINSENIFSLNEKKRVCFPPLAIIHIYIILMNK